MRMDFWDLLRRFAKVGEYLATALACVLLMLRVAPELRLPPVVIAVLMTSLGVTRDVARERKSGRQVQ